MLEDSNSGSGGGTPRAFRACGVTADARSREAAQIAQALHLQICEGICLPVKGGDRWACKCMSHEESAHSSEKPLW